MSRRWEHLDRDRPALSPEEAAPQAAPKRDAGVGPSAPPTSYRAPARCHHPALQTAWAHYRLGSYEAAADAAADALAADPTLPGGHRLLGLAQGHLPHTRVQAVESLRQAAALAPDDLQLRASLVAAELRAGQQPGPVQDPCGPLAELAGAAEWARGRDQLSRGQPGAAAEAFRRSIDLFQAHPSRENQPERLAACYVGLAVSLLVSGRWYDAQAAYTRTLGRASVAAAVGEFARRVYEVTEAVLELPPSERAEAVAPLADLLDGVRLKVEFHDGSRPVRLSWDLA